MSGTRPCFAHPRVMQIRNEVQTFLAFLGDKANDMTAPEIYKEFVKWKTRRMW